MAKLIELSESTRVYSRYIYISYYLMMVGLPSYLWENHLTTIDGLKSGDANAIKIQLEMVRIPSISDKSLCMVGIIYGFEITTLVGNLDS